MIDVEWIAVSADGSGTYKPEMVTDAIVENAAVIVAAYDEAINDF